MVGVGFERAWRTTMRHPEMRRTKREAPIAVGGRPPASEERVIAIEMVLFGVCSSRSPWRSASAASFARKGGISACRSASSRVHPSAPRWSRVQKRSRIGHAEARPG